MHPGAAPRFVARKSVLAVTSGLELEAVELGFEPVAVIAWWTQQGDDGTSLGNSGGMGLWTAQATGSVAWISEDAQPSARVHRVADTAALVGLGRPGHDLTMRAELETYGPTGLSLRFTTRPSEPWIVHLLAVGGSSLRAHMGVAPPSASHRTELALGGLRPDLVFFVPASSGEGTQLLDVGIGAAAREGRAAAGYTLANGSSPGAVTGAQRHDAAVVLLAPGSTSVQVASMSTSASLAGFLERRGDEREWPGLLYLAIDGVRAAVGTDVSPRTPGSRRTRVGFRPEALLAFSWGLSAAVGSRGIGRLCVGGAAGADSGCAGWDDRNVEAERTNTHVLTSFEHLVVVSDTRTGGVHADAALVSLDDRGFRLEWARSDGVAREFAYVALAADEPRSRSAGRRAASRVARNLRPR